MTLAELKARWLELKGIPLPKFMRRRLMLRAVAHAMDEAAHGGLDPATQAKLDDLVAAIVPKIEGAKPALVRRAIKAGTRLLREWQGTVHEVTVIPDGYLWKGKSYPSLSAIARLISGTRWNGWTFFGLKKQGTAAVASLGGARPKRAGVMAAKKSGATRQAGKINRRTRNSLDATTNG